MLSRFLWFLSPSSAPDLSRWSCGEHPHGAFCEVVGDRSLGEPPARSVPAVDPGAGPEQSEGRKLGVALDEVTVTNAVDDHSLEVIAHGLVHPTDLLQRAGRKGVLLTQVDMDGVEIPENAKHVRPHHRAESLAGGDRQSRRYFQFAQHVLRAALE